MHFEPAVFEQVCTCSVCDLDDEGVTEYDKSEGQGQNSKHAAQAAAPKQIAASQKVW